MKIGLLGCGAYGLALSSIMHDNYCEITMWTRLQEEADELTKTRCNKEKLPGYKIPEDIKITIIGTFTLPNFFSFGRSSCKASAFLALST